MRRLLLASAMFLTTVAAADNTRHDGEEILRIAGDYLTAHVQARQAGLTRVEMIPLVAAEKMHATGEVLLPRLQSDRRLGRRVCVWVDVMQGGQRVASVPVWFALHTYRTTLVTTRPLRPKQPVHAGDVVLAEREVTGVDDVLSELNAVESTRVKRYVKAGAALRGSDLEAIPAVLPEQEVMVHVVSGAFDIETTGVAQQEGRLGEMILVRNPSSGTNYRAQVTSRNRVEVVNR